MNRRNILAMLTMVGALLLAAGCGGGGAPGVVLTLSTAGTLPNGTLIGGNDVNIVLPPGVRVNMATNASPNSSAVNYNSDIVKISGVAVNPKAMVIVTQTKANVLNVKIINPYGFDVGEFAKVTLAIDTQVAASDFKTTDFLPVDLNGAPIPGLSVGLTASVQ